MKIVLFLIFITTVSFAQYQIRGKVLDRSSRDPIPFANISLPQESHGTVADESGKFAMEFPTPVRGTFSVSSMGYQSKKIDFEITQTQPTIILEIFLESQVIPTAPVIITANRLSQSTGDVPASLQIISSQDIQTHSDQTVGDLLARSGAYNIRQYGGGGIQTLSLRGSGSEHILVLVDGQRLNSAQMQTIDLSLFSSGDIEQVEIYKGGFSALYGSEAVGGIIQIITKSIPSRSETSFSTERGAYGLSSNRVRVGTRIGHMGFSLSFLDEQDKNNFEYQVEGYQGFRKNNDRIRQNLQVKTQFYPSDDRLYQLNLIYGRTNRGTPGTVNFEHVDARQQDDMMLFQLVEDRLLRNELREKDGRTSLKTQFNYRRLIRGYQDPLIAVNSKQQNTNSGITQELFLPLKRGRWIAGWEAEEEQIRSTDLGHRLRHHGGIFSILEHTYRFSYFWLNELMLTPAIRLDGYSQYTSRLSPKAGFVWKHRGEDLGQDGLRISYGKNYRMPSFDDLYWPGAGNPSLKPETSWNWDGGIFSSREFLGTLTGEVNYFHNILKNKIEWQPSSVNPNFWSPQNIGDALAEGVELIGQWDSYQERFSARVNYTFQKVTDQTVQSSTFGKTLIYQPREMWNGQFRVRGKDWNLGMTARYIGSRFFDSQNRPGLFLPSSWTWDLDLGKKLTWGNLNLEFRGSVENLSDQKYQLVYLYPMPGRVWKISLQLKNE